MSLQTPKRLDRIERGRTTLPVSRLFAVLLSSLIALSFFSGCSGTSSGISNPVAPTALAYSQSSLSAVVGQALIPDVPSVNGTVLVYSISPALPSGIVLSSTTGAITGSPTTVAASASYTVNASNSSGSTTAALTISVAPAAPASLIYPVSSLSGFVGEAIAADTPTFTGSPATFSIAPALTAGLTLNSTTGSITGTPTAVSPSATYTVTASNSSGATTTILTLAFAPAAPSNLVYPVTTISATVGQAITTDTPTYTGSPVSFSISPALPPGISISPATGTITGTPTHYAAQTSYTVTATNATGTSTGVLSILVLNHQKVLIDLGQTGAINSLQLSQTRLLEQDSVDLVDYPQSSHWGLYDYTTTKKIVDSTEENAGKIYLAGSVFVVDASTTTKPVALEIHSATDGSVLGRVTTPFTWWRLATDGSYLVLGSSTALTVYSTSGNVLVSHPGDYHAAVTFAAPQQVQVAQGPAGSNVIETISPLYGTSKTTMPFNGIFQDWFSDGARFITVAGSVTAVYSNQGTLQGLVSLSSLNNLGGTGNWLYNTVTSSDPTGKIQTALQIFPVGSSSPSSVFTFNGATTQVYGITASGNTIAVIGFPIVSVIDLSGSSPIQQTYALTDKTATSTGVYGAYSSSQFVLGNGFGAILDGASLNGPHRYFGIGIPITLAGSSAYASLASSTGAILPFDAKTLEPLPDIPFPGNSPRMQLSAAGTTLAAATPYTGLSSTYTAGQSVEILSFPSGSPQYTWPNSFGFTLSSSGALFAQAAFGSSSNYSLETAPTTGGAATVLVQGTSNSGSFPRTSISPDDSMVAVTLPYSSTSIYKDGVLLAAVQGAAVGWLDNNRLLVDLFTFTHGSRSYVSTQIISPTGAVLATPSLPELYSLQVVTADQVYDAVTNTIYSISTGGAVWKGNNPATMTSGGVEGTVAGAYVLYVSGTKVLAETY